MAAPWQNADGLSVPFASYWGDPKNFINRPRAVNSYGPIKQAVIRYDLARLPATGISYPRDLNNDGTNDGFDTGCFYFPAQASILRVVGVATEAAAGGTSIKLGLFALTGTEIDDDFLITTTEGAKTALDTVGARIYGAGVGVATTAETAGVGAADAFLAFTTNGTFTAGKGIIVIDYIDATVDS